VGEKTGGQTVIFGEFGFEPPVAGGVMQQRFIGEDGVAAAGRSGEGFKGLVVTFGGACSRANVWTAVAARDSRADAGREGTGDTITLVLCEGNRETAPLSRQLRVDRDRDVAQDFMGEQEGDVA
jgi:hypothetical protein